MPVIDETDSPYGFYSEWECGSYAMRLYRRVVTNKSLTLAAAIPRGMTLSPAILHACILYQGWSYIDTGAAVMLCTVAQTMFFSTAMLSISTPFADQITTYTRNV